MDDQEDNFTIKQQLVRRNIGLLELLGVAFIIFKTQFKTFFIVILLLGIPLNIAQSLYPIPSINIAELQSGKFSSEMNESLLIMGCHFIFSLMLSSLQIASTVFIVKKTLLNRHVDASAAMKFAIRKFPKVFITYVLYTIFILLGAAAFVLPGVIISILFMLSIYISAERSEWGISAFKYAFGMVKKNAIKITTTFMFTTLFQISFIVVFGGYVSTAEKYYVLYNISYYLSMYILIGYLTTVSTSLFFHFEYNYGNRRKI